MLYTKGEVKAFLELMATEDMNTSPSYKIIWSTTVFFLSLSKMKWPSNTKQFCSYQPQNLCSVHSWQEKDQCCVSTAT